MKINYYCICLIALLTGCTQYEYTNEEFIGKSKIEILEFAFEKFPRVFNDELQIRIIIADTNKRANYYYKNLKSATEDQRLMDSNIWHIGFKDYPFEDYYFKTICYILIFENNKVISVRHWADTK